MHGQCRRYFVNHRSFCRKYLRNSVTAKAGSADQPLLHSLFTVGIGATISWNLSAIVSMPFKGISPYLGSSLAVSEL